MASGSGQGRQWGCKSLAGLRVSVMIYTMQVHGYRLGLPWSHLSQSYKPLLSLRCHSTGCMAARGGPHEPHPVSR